MLGDFLTRILILLLGYAYPGFECYKTVEKNRVQIEELRFWCQYWIIVALVTVLERFTDIFVGWLPLYGEMKVAFFVYLWYPKVKGTGFVYQTVLRPIVSRHENEIDRQLLELKARGRDLVAHYWQISAKMGHSAFFQGLEYLATQSVRLKASPPQSYMQQDSAPREMNASKKSSSEDNSAVGKIKKSPPSPPPSPSIKRVETPKFRSVRVHHQVLEDDVILKEGEEGYSKDALNQARARLRRLNTGSPRSPHSPIRREL
ncbi:putative HVA22-like protein g isoform X2 [Prosopis cineraria]|uniref:putative HVA22-like protein g isoform X2 n=1 Tax=Prosopis cineraria TaxID=364024 RepID=UPI00240EFFB2|nr:putative HVA22-like protein g isoform X2 [Prosopis cineraria]